MNKAWVKPALSRLAPRYLSGEKKIPKKKAGITRICAIKILHLFTDQALVKHGRPVKK